MKTCPVCDTPFPDQHSTCPTDGAVLIENRELAPGHVVRGKYRIVRKLGQGGMGVVYLAEHQLLGGKLALKFLAVALSQDPQFVKRFRNEARAAYQLRHPNIVEVADLDQDEDGSLFIAMEFVGGTNLRAALREAKEPLPVARALNIARGVAAGLAAAHARGAIHRDIKPDNILLRTERDGGEQAKILDFGIAVVTEGATNLSRTHGLLLTPEYAAPEQWMGTAGAELDGRTDLYALGGVLYEMLAGRTPFRAANPQGWMYQHLQGVPEPLGKLRPDLERGHPGLEAVVMRLLAREREERFASAEAFLEAIAAKSNALRPASRVEPAPVALPGPAWQAAPAVAPVVPAAPTYPPAVEAQAEARTPVPAAARAGPADKAAFEGPDRDVQLSGKPRGRVPRWVVWSALGAMIALVAILFLAGVFRATPVTAVPTITPAGGTYAEPQPIYIADATANAVIHYTVDGSPPTGASPVYSQPLTGLPSGAVVRAIATAEGHKPSSDITGVFLWSGAAKSMAAPQTGSVYDQGKDAYDHKKYAQARTLFGQACDGGELRGCNYLGYLYAQGLGGSADATKARAVYQGACDKGNLSSCASLGTLYEDGGNKAEAQKYFKKACDGGLADGCELLRGVQATPSSPQPTSGAAAMLILKPTVKPDPEAWGTSAGEQLEIVSEIKGDHGHRLCLDVEGAAFRVGAGLVVWECLGGANQRFTFTPDGQITIAGFCVDAHGRVSFEGVSLQSCVGTPNQHWSRDSSGRIKVAYSERNGTLCLRFNPNGSYSDGMGVFVGPCSGDKHDGEIWSVR